MKNVLKINEFRPTRGVQRPSDIICNGGRTPPPSHMNSKRSNGDADRNQDGRWWAGQRAHDERHRRRLNRSEYRGARGTRSASWPGGGLGLTMCVRAISLFLSLVRLLYALVLPPPHPATERVWVRGTYKRYLRPARRRRVISVTPLAAAMLIAAAGRQKGARRRWPHDGGKLHRTQSSSANRLRRRRASGSGRSRTSTACREGVARRRRAGQTLNYWFGGRCGMAGGEGRRCGWGVRLVGGTRGGGAASESVLL